MSRLEKIKNKEQLIYSRTEKTSEPRALNKFYVGLVLLLVAGLAYLIVFSGLFEIKNINVSGYRYNDKIKEIASEQVNENIITKNILFFSTNNLEKTLLGDPRIKDIKVNKIYPNNLELLVTEAKPAALWISAGDKFLVDERGVVMAEATGQNEKFIEINDASNIKVKAGERVASPTFIKFIKDISAGFEAAASSKLIKITLFDILEDVHILSSDGWSVYFNATKSADSQLNNMSRVLAEARKDKKKLQYIDMRLDNKIFYK